MSLGSKLPRGSLRSGSTIDMSDETTPVSQWGVLLSRIALDPTVNCLVILNKDLGRSGAMAIASLLRSSTSLEQLHLRSNGFPIQGMRAIAEALTNNYTLVHLVLRCNDVGDIGAKAIASALATNKTLRELDLSDANIGTRGAEAIATALKDNTTLETLHLWGNAIGPQLQATLRQIAAASQRLEIRGLDGQKPEESKKGFLERLLKQWSPRERG